MVGILDNIRACGIWCIVTSLLLGFQVDGLVASGTDDWIFFLPNPLLILSSSLAGVAVCVSCQSGRIVLGFVVPTFPHPKISVEEISRLLLLLCVELSEVLEV